MQNVGVAGINLINPQNCNNLNVCALQRIIIFVHIYLLKERLLIDECVSVFWLGVCV